MTARATSDQLRDARLIAEKLVYVVRGFLAVSPEPPCRVCRANGVECPLCRITKAAQAVLAEWGKK